MQAFLATKMIPALHFDNAPLCPLRGAAWNSPARPIATVTRKGTVHLPALLQRS